jgi:phospholipase C
MPTFNRGTGMILKQSKSRRTISALVLSSFGFTTTGHAVDLVRPVDLLKTASPIKHVIVIIGENRSFDHVFATYKPRHDQGIANLLSKGIVNEDGTPGPKFAKSAQYTVLPQAQYFISADKVNKTAYVTLPPPDLNGVPLAASDANSAPPFATIAKASASEPDLEPSDEVLLTTGAATGLTFTNETGGIRNPDIRITNVHALPNGPFQLTGPTLPYDSYTEDTIHRFYQMWQQTDCSTDSEHATKRNPTGCLSDLWPFVTTTFAGTAENGMGTPMAFFNVAKGDAPVLKRLADQYTLSDNFHQAAMGGTGISHIYLGTADNLFYSDGQGNPVKPIAPLVGNPNPVSGTNNQYINDGYYTACADAAQPGVSPIANYLSSLPYKTSANCAAGHYYLLNNLLPAYHADGTLDKGNAALGLSPFAVVPASTIRTIGDALIEKNIPWAYYGGGYNLAVAAGANDILTPFCPICNPFQYTSSIMGSDAVRKAHTKDVLDLYNDIANDTLPAISYVKPDEFLDGHPQSSKLDLFEAFVDNILDKVKAKPELFESTAIIVTFDEGGGYYDSGFIQPIDFFGDGPRIPLLVVSPYSKGGHVVHTYYDHVSVVKFIERNWGLKPLTDRSRDNLPNPRLNEENPYVPANMPAIGDLFDMFDFGHDDDHREGDRF